MSELVQIGGHSDGLGATTRGDRWWIEPLLYGGGFGLFVIYSTWAALQGNHYWIDGGGAGYGGYLSPFYSPVLFGDPTAAGSVPMAHAWLGAWPGWWPDFLPASPALLILGFPLSFRLTCYYYRKFYYRSFFAAPIGCAVGGRKQNYKGETRLFVFQNLHRYAMYFAIVFVVILSYDAYQSFWRNGKLGIGVGTIILTINPILIAGYTFGCHAFRNIVGGGKNLFSSCSSGRNAIYKGCSSLNSKHQLWAWMSLIWVAWADIYIRLVSSGVLTDYNTWN